MLEKLYEERRQANNFRIEALRRENEELERKAKGSRKRKGIKKWLGFTFESSSSETREFRSFVRDFKKALKNDTEKDFDLVNFSKGHFECSGFLRSKENGRMVYFSISDVRSFPDDWFNNVLIRTAKNERDYTGGSNNYCRFYEIREKALRLINWG